MEREVATYTYYPPPKSPPLTYLTQSRRPLLPSLNDRARRVTPPPAPSFVTVLELELAKEEEEELLLEVVVLCSSLGVVVVVVCSASVVEDPTPTEGEEEEELAELEVISAFHREVSVPVRG